MEANIWSHSTHHTITYKVTEYFFFFSFLCWEKSFLLVGPIRRDGHVWIKWSFFLRIEWKFVYIGNNGWRVQWIHFEDFWKVSITSLLQPKGICWFTYRSKFWQNAKTTSEFSYTFCRTKYSIKVIPTFLAYNRGIFSRSNICWCATAVFQPTLQIIRSSTSSNIK